MPPFDRSVDPDDATSVADALSGSASRSGVVVARSTRSEPVGVGAVVPVASATPGDQTIRVLDGEIRCLLSADYEGRGRPATVCGRTDGASFQNKRNALRVVARASSWGSSLRALAIASNTLGRYMGSLRRVAGLGFRSRGKRYGASVSMSKRSCGM